MSPRATQSRADTRAAPLAPPPERPGTGVTRKEAEMKITANGGGAVAEQGPRPSLIRTPDQRLRVFVSSSLQELAAERGVVRGAIEQLRLAPGMFESGGRPPPPRA